MEESFFKILMIGPKGAGKSSLLHYTKNCEFDPTLAPTAGANFCIKKVGTVEGRKEIKLQIWDLAGSKTFQNISDSYFSDAKACIFVIDNTRTESFDTDGWNERLWRWEAQNSNENIEFYLIALNKADLENGTEIRNRSLVGTPLEWVMDKEAPIIETSAKTGKGIDDLFALLTNMLIYRDNLKLEPQQIKLKNVIYLPNSWSSEKKRNLNLMEEKEEVISQPSRELEEREAYEEAKEPVIRIGNQGASNLDTCKRISEGSTNITQSKELSTSSKEITSDRDVVQTNIRNQSREASESREKFELRIRKSSEYIDDSVIKDVIFNDIPPESLIETLRTENNAPKTLNKEDIKEKIINSFCPDSICAKIKQITELTFDTLQEIIRQNVDEENISNPSEIDRYYISSKIFSHFNQNHEAIFCLKHIISIAKSKGNKEWESFAAIRSAEILKKGKKFGEAIEYYKKALHIYKEMNNLQRQTSLLNNIASVYYKLEKYSKALSYFKEALQVDKKLGNVSSQANREYWIGAIFSKINQKQDALLHLKNALNLYNQIGRREEAEEIRSFIDHLEIY